MPNTAEKKSVYVLVVTPTCPDTRHKFSTLSELAQLLTTGVADNASFSIEDENGDYVFEID